MIDPRTLVPAKSGNTPSPQHSSQFSDRLLAGTIQLDQAHLLDLLVQELRRSPLTDRWRICSRLTPRLAHESAAQAHPSQLNRSGLGMLDRVENPGAGESPVGLGRGQGDA